MPGSRESQEAGLVRARWEGQRGPGGGSGQQGFVTPDRSSDFELNLNSGPYL